MDNLSICECLMPDQEGYYEYNSKNAQFFIPVEFVMNEETGNFSCEIVKNYFLKRYFCR